METVIVSVIIGLWLLIFVPMALVPLLPEPHERTERTGAPLFRAGRRKSAEAVNSHRPAA